MELTVREAARRVGRSEETIRRWIWSGRLRATKRGAGYRIDVRHLEEAAVGLEQGFPRSHAAEPPSMLEWLAAVDAWKHDQVTVPGASAADLIAEDRRARR